MNRDKDEYEELKSLISAHEEYISLCYSHGGNNPNHSNYLHILNVIEITKSKIEEFKNQLKIVEKKLAPKVL